MKKLNQTTKLSLSAETVRALAAIEMTNAHGGAAMTGVSCLTMGTACHVTYSAVCTMFPACGY